MNNHKRNCQMSALGWAATVPPICTCNTTEEKTYDLPSENETTFRIGGTNPPSSPKDWVIELNKVFSAAFREAKFTSKESAFFQSKLFKETEECFLSLLQATRAEVIRGYKEELIQQITRNSFDDPSYGTVVKLPAVLSFITDNKNKEI